MFWSSATSKCENWHNPFNTIISTFPLCLFCMYPFYYFLLSLSHPDLDVEGDAHKQGKTITWPLCDRV